VIPLVDSKRPEMLHAVYSKNCLPVLHYCLQNDRLRLTDFLQDITAHYVQPERVAQFDADFYSFFNLNTPEDLEKAQEIAT
jgi:molybdopterin-guanine dinucleotide biosynthesis protein A